MQLFDTLSGKKREFQPLTDKPIRIYTCGPSVYDYSHIGNFRTYLFEDILVRYLIYKGYRVKRVMNVTDIEDKAIEASHKMDVSLEKLVNDKINRFFADYDSLGMLRPDRIVKASEYIPKMLELIEKL
ncbi:cysteine--tRNA ligase, partial [Candidatus Micrarchaeota archaeon]|nr:cysteine--tRNA ligase [Candidatus Micrarchaeota archaeon]